MAILKYKNSKGEYVEIPTYTFQSPTPVQTTGDSVIDVMSQNAVTTELNKKANSRDVYTISEIDNKNFLTESYASTNNPKEAGNVSAGTSINYARADHVHPAQTNITGNAGTATKLQTARNIKLTGAVTGNVNVDGSSNVELATTLSNLDASKITSGTIDLERLPVGALERLVVVANESAALSANIQEGDVVQITGNSNKMYFCISNTATTFNTKFKEFTAGTATSVPWSGVTGKPTTFTPSTHNQASNTITSLTGYTKGTAQALVASDNLNTALGKLEAGVNDSVHSVDFTSDTLNVTSNKTDTSVSVTADLVWKDDATQQNIQFKKYKNDVDVDVTTLSKGDVTFVQNSRKLYIGQKPYHFDRSGLRGGVVVDKIWSNNICYLPCSASIGYRIGYCNTQKIYISVTDIFAHKDISDTLKLRVHTIKQSHIDGADQVFPEFRNLTLSYNITDTSVTVSSNKNISFKSNKFINFPLSNSSVTIDTGAKYNLNKTMITIWADRDKTGKWFENSGFFEMTVNGWKFHKCDNMIGNSGTKQIINDAVIDIKNKVKTENLFKSLCNKLYPKSTFLTVFEQIIYHYERLTQKTHRKYFLFAKFRHNYRTNRIVGPTKHIYNPIIYKRVQIANIKFSTPTINPQTGKEYTHNGMTLRRIYNSACVNGGVWNNATMLNVKQYLGKIKFSYDKSSFNITRQKYISYIDFLIATYSSEKGHQHKSVITMNQNSLKFRVYFKKDQFYIDIK